MKIAYFKSYGKAEDVVECINSEPIKDPKDDELLIEIIAFPINPADLLNLEGKYAMKQDLPSKLGAECVARVKYLGKNVKRFKEGDIVMPLDRDNWVQEKIVNEKDLILLPKGINLLQASMLKVNPATAYLMLNNYINLNKNDWVVQNASNSMVGQYVINLSRSYGIKTINLVRRKGLEEMLKILGANIVIQYDDINSISDLVDKNNIKLAIDAVGGKDTLSLADMIAPGGTIINYGLLSGKNIELDSKQVVFKDISLKGFWLSLWLQKMIFKEKNKLYKHLSNMILEKAISIPIEKTYLIEDIKEAVKHTAAYNREGKIIVLANGQIN